MQKIENKNLLHLWKFFITFIKDIVRDTLYNILAFMEKKFITFVDIFLLHLWFFLLHLWKVFITFVEFVTFVHKILLHL